MVVGPTTSVWTYFLRGTTGPKSICLYNVRGVYGDIRATCTNCNIKFGHLAVCAYFLVFCLIMFEIVNDSKIINLHLMFLTKPLILFLFVEHTHQFYTAFIPLQTLHSTSFNFRVILNNFFYRVFRLCVFLPTFSTPVSQDFFIL